jgi:pimeloyl-ACP methyl ester carboxylesterase
MRIAVILLVCLICGCDKSASLDQDSTKSVLRLCPGFSTQGKPPLVSGAECGVLPVAENPQEQNGNIIELKILRLPAINPVPKDDPLFIIAGGPGQSAVEVAELLFYVFEDIRKYRDIVFVDQRGTGSSNPLECEGLAALGQKLTFADQKAAITSALRECADQLGDRYQFYTTPYAVQDLDSVRRALNYPRINIWSVSYGTRVALEFMRRYPQSTRVAILDGVAPVAMALPWFAERDALSALQAINQQCAQTAQCVERYGDLLEQAQVVAERLQHASVEVEIEHPSTRLAYHLTMTHEVFASAVRMVLYSRDLSRLLPLAISQSHAGDYQLLTALVAIAEHRGGLADISLGMHYTILCNEDFPQYHLKDSASSEKFLLLNAVQAGREACELWPRQPLPADYFSPVQSAVPTLLLSGARDPVTPPVWAEQVLSGLTRAKHAIAPGGHHSITRDGCTARLIAQFIQTADIEHLDTSCVQKILPLSPYYELIQGWELMQDRELTQDTLNALGAQAGNEQQKAEQQKTEQKEQQ